MPQFSAMIAEALLLCEEPDGAATWLGEARDFMDSHGDLYFGADVLRAALTAFPNPQPWPDLVHASSLSSVQRPLAASESHL